MFLSTRRVLYPAAHQLHFRVAPSLGFHSTRRLRLAPIFPRTSSPLLLRFQRSSSWSDRSASGNHWPTSTKAFSLGSNTGEQLNPLASAAENLPSEASPQYPALLPDAVPANSIHPVEDQSTYTTLQSVTAAGGLNRSFSDFAADVDGMDLLELLTSLALIFFASVSAAAFVFVVFVTVGVLFQPRWIISFVRKRLPHIVFEYVTRDKLVALTIDDSPNGESTSDILDILKEYGCKATFFVIGSNVDKYPELVERMHLEGHEIGNHTMDDVPSWRMPLDTLEMSLLEVDTKLQRFFRTDENGKPLKWFRPGHGWSTKPMRQLVESHGYRLALGSVFPVDPLFKKSGGPLAEYCLWKIYPGAILILHDRPQQASQTKEILRRILPALRDQGYQLVTLSEIAKHADMSGKDPETVSLV